MDWSRGVDLVVMVAVDVVFVTVDGVIVFVTAVDFASLIFIFTVLPAVPSRVHFGYVSLGRVVGVVDGVVDGFSILCRRF